MEQQPTHQLQQEVLQAAYVQSQGEMQAIQNRLDYIKHQMQLSGANLPDQTSAVEKITTSDMGGFQAGILEPPKALRGRPRKYPLPDKLDSANLKPRRQQTPEARARISQAARERHARTKQQQNDSLAAAIRATTPTPAVEAPSETNIAEPQEHQLAQAARAN